jgi:uncharacterized membrane protein
MTQDGVGDRLVRHAEAWFWPVLYGMLVGSSTWWLSHPDVFSAVADNRLADAFRYSAVRWTLAGMALVPLGYLALLYRKNSRPLLPGVVALNRALSPVLALPMCLALLRSGFERGHPQMTVFFALAVAGVAGVVAYRLPLWGWPKAWPSWTQTASAWSAVVALWIGYGVFFSQLAIINHHGLNTSTFDLGIYDNIFYQSLHGTFLGCSFLPGNYHGSAHFDPILTLMSPAYLLYPRAESILVLQSFWLGSGVFPLYALARRRLECPARAVCIGAVWLLYPALHGANMYDFHSLSLLAPVILWLFYFVEVKSAWGYWLTFALALSVREDVPLLLSFIAGSMLLGAPGFGRRQAWRTIALSLVYFVVVKAFFMSAPEKVLQGTKQYSFAYYYSDLIPNRTGLGEMLRSLLTNPGYVMKHIVREQKMQFLLLLFAPLLFLPFFAKPLRWALVYGFAFCLLATRPAVYSIYFQYAVVIYSVAFPAALIAFDQLSDRVPAWGLDRSRVMRSVLVGMLTCSAILSFKFGGLFENEAFRGGFVVPKRELSDAERERYVWVEEAAALIPKQARVATTRRMGPHVSNRSGAFQYFAKGEFDFLFLDEREISKKRQAAHRRFLKDGGYEVLRRSGKLVLYARSQP